MNASYAETVSKIVESHLDSAKIYQKVVEDVDFEKLSEFFADFHKKHNYFAEQLLTGDSQLPENLVEHAPLRKQEEELFAAVSANNEFSIYEICLHNERQIMKMYEEALAANDDPSDAFQKNLDTITTIVRRLERAKTVPAVKNILVDL